MKAWAILRGTFLLAAVSLSGCKSTPPGPPCESLACVEIQRHDAMEVARTLSQVFRDAGYAAAPLPPNKDMMLMFEKQGGTGDMLLYGDWSGKPPWSRVKLNIKSRDPQNHLVECNVYRVLDRGDPRFEEETRTRINRKAYQELLNLAKAKLDATPASPPGT